MKIPSGLLQFVRIHNLQSQTNIQKWPNCMVRRVTAAETLLVSPPRFQAFHWAMCNYAWKVISPPLGLECTRHRLTVCS